MKKKTPIDKKTPLGKFGIWASHVETTGNEIQTRVQHFEGSSPLYDLHDVLLGKTATGRTTKWPLLALVALEPPLQLQSLPLPHPAPTTYIT